MKYFTHRPVSLPELSTEERDNKRYYITPTDARYPSVTTLLGLASKEGMDAWRKSIGEEEAHRISKYACDLGTLLHEHVEKYLDNHINPLENCTSHSKYMFNGLKENLDKIDNIIVQEKALYSDILRIAGRTDCIAEYDGELSIIDFKTARKEKKEEWIQSYFVQGTAYSLMLEELTGICVSNIVIPMITYESQPMIFKSKRKKHFKELDRILKEYLPSLEYNYEI